MGSSVQLRRFNCEIQRTAAGSVQFNFKVKNTSFQLLSDSNLDVSSFEQSVDLPWDVKQMKRGLSFENE
jgi:hypothetical protein